MAVLKAFQAVRPAKEMAARIAALPYDVVDRREAKEIGEKNPDSFLHVDRAEMDLPDETDLYDPKVYEKARKNLQGMCERGAMIKDEVPCYYIYEQERLGKKQAGIVGCASIDDYEQGIVKKHENTRVDKEQDRIRHVDATDANTGPIFLAAVYPASLKETVAAWQRANAPVYDFVSEDGIAHRVWVIDDPEKNAQICKAFESIPGFYIADGHHRAASAVKVGKMRRQAHPDYDGSEEFNGFLSVVFPYDELTILAYHRIVRIPEGMDKGSLVSSLSEHFEIEALPEAALPKRKHEICLYMQGSWMKLTVLPEELKGTDVVSQLDVSLLQDLVLTPLFGIEDPRSDARIRFVGGNKSLSELAEIADAHQSIAFAMYPTSMEDLMQIADEGRLMPPKSTWFEPKLRSGLFIHQLS